MYNIYSHPNSCTNDISILDPLEESGGCLAVSMHSSPNQSGALLSGLSPGVQSSCSCVSSPVLEISSSPALKPRHCTCQIYFRVQRHWLSPASKATLEVQTSPLEDVLSGDAI